MVYKGIVSAIFSDQKKIEVIIPELDVVTMPIPLYRTNDVDLLKVNDFVLVVAFNNDLNDAIVL